jgi:enamine deaminase RidA (YjgF/YER057c/UK114 family)
VSRPVQVSSSKPYKTHRLPREAGRHTRAAVGMAELPVDIAVEIELVARIR